MRLFVAVEVPAGVRAEVVRALDEVRAVAPAGLRWSDPSRWHLTLAFLGEVAEARLPDLQTRLARAAARHPALSLRIAGAGRFGGGVLWAGVRAEGARPDVLGRLAASVSAAARHAGIPQQEQRFRPHLTLARAARPVDLRDLVDRLAGLAGSPWTAEAVHLVRSTLGPRPEHTTLSTFPLDGR